MHKQLEQILVFILRCSNNFVNFLLGLVFYLVLHVCKVKVSVCFERVVGALALMLGVELIHIGG